MRLLRSTVQAAENPNGAPLAPEPFVAADEAPFVGEARIQATRFIDRMLQPKGNHLTEQAIRQSIVKTTKLNWRHCRTGSMIHSSGT
jgi:hypothetical protein